MRKFLKNRKLLIVLAIVIVLLIVALATAGNRQVTWLESTLGTVTRPVQAFSVKASNYIIDFFQRVFKTTDADKENEQLRVRLAQLEQVQTELEEAKQENARLRGLLGFVESAPEYTYVTANVIGRTQGVWFDVFTINAGRNDGVEEDMPVVNASGLIGRVTDVGATWSKVTAIIDSSSTVSITVERTRDNGMVRGLLDSAGSEEIELYYLPAGSDIVPGDVIVTNGIGGVFPKGIVVGKVTEVSRGGEDSGERNAVVQPSVDFQRLEEVMVIVSIEAGGGAAAESAGGQ